MDFSITDRDLEFYDRVSPVFAGKKEPIPAPRLCPDCRRQRRLAFRNEHKLYKRKCDLTGKDIVSVYSPESRTVVYEYVEWWGDAWDATIYGVDFDFMKPLSMQFLALNNVVPKAHVEVSESENSVYTNQAGYNKNCYFTFEAGFNEDCSYSVRIWNSRDTSDALSVKSLENCHECIDVQNSSGVFFSQSCRDCHDSQYLFDCRNCRNCIGCWNLRDKQYHILNAPVTREVFEKTLSDLREPKKRSQLQALVAQKKRDTCVYLAADHTGSENAVGDNVFNSRNVLGLDMTDCKDCRYCSVQYQAQDCMDYEYW